jgi:DHA1 family purine ribonucleoside efflux pump-like MFS transporter
LFVTLRDFHGKTPRQVTKMIETSSAQPLHNGVTRPNWSAVFAVAFCVACLITVEFLPVSLLTPMAQDLGVSEGVAGQSVSVTAFVAMFASLFITNIIGKTDRRYVVIAFSILLTLSCLLVSFASNFALMLVGRALLGLALGGFWAMSASLTLRLVPARTIPKALSVIFGAVSIALVIAAPLGSFLGGIIGWRHVFNGAAVMGLLCIAWVWKALPSMPGQTEHHQNMFGLLKRPGVLAGMIAIFMAFAGQFSFFTYIRPVYMNMAGFDVDGLTLVLLSFGIASFVGTSFSSHILKRSVKLALACAPLILAISALVLILWGSDKVVASGIAIVWGLAFALIPVGWSTWITRSLADQAEKAGSIQVAVIQLANTCGAAVGGYAIDNLGLLSPLVLAGSLMLLTALLVASKVKVK